MRPASGLPRLILLSDAALLEGTPEGEARWFDEVLPAVLAAARPRSVQVQLRHKEASAVERLRRARTLRQWTRRFHQSFVVNDRLDIALLCDADGIHLPERGVSVGEARRLLGAQRWVSRAWHGEPIARAASAPDAWLLSPVAEPRKGRPALGVEGLRRAVEGLRAARGPNELVPVYALGGLDGAAAAACLEAGAAGVAVLGGAATLSSAFALLAALQIRV